MTTPPIVWISATHQLACADHAPAIGSDAWWLGAWRLMSEHEQLGFQRARGTAPECAACLAEVELAALGVGGLS